MPLDKQQIQTLLNFVADTSEDEITCDECLAGMAEFVETQLLRKRGPDLVRAAAARQRAGARMS